MERPGSRDMGREGRRLSEREVSKSNLVALPKIVHRDPSTPLRFARDDLKAGPRI